VSTTDFLKGKRVTIFEAPGVDAPVCATKHSTGHVDQANRPAAGGTDEIVCVSVNYPFVMFACAEKYVATGKVFMPPDPKAALTCALRFDVDLSTEGLDQRSQHYSILVVKGIATSVHVAKGIFESSAASRRLTPEPGA
jgi:cytochrome c peroxidase